MRFPETFLEDLRARLPVSEVVGRRVKLRRAGPEWLGLSPFNKERSPSFTVHDGKGFYHDFSSGKHGDIFDFMMETEGLTFPEAVEQLAFLAGVAMPSDREAVSPRTEPVEARLAPARQAQADEGAQRNQRMASDLWREGVSIIDTVVIKHLASRGIHELAPGIDGRALRFHPCCPLGADRHPAMLALLQDVYSDEPRAIHRTALTSTGQKIGRKVLGPKSGAAVKLSSDVDVTLGLTIGEGIETTLSGMVFGFSPAWAVGDAGELGAFPVLSGIECLTIIVDNDESGTGQRRALECSERWTSAGREVRRVIPDRAGNDLNDLLSGAAA